MKVAAIWISTAIAVAVGIYITKSANCLWAFLLAVGGTDAIGRNYDL